MNLLHRLPIFVVNGIAVALGIGCIQLVIIALVDSHAAQLALSGAVCASLADVPNTVSRTWQRVSAAAVLSLCSAIIVVIVRPYPLPLGVGIAAIAFIAMMMMAWGARAGAVSFTPILSLIFIMAVPPGSESTVALVGWIALGGTGYLIWSLMVARVLQRRYRTLALSNTLRASADLLRARADLLLSAQSEAVDPNAMQAWIKGEAVLAERMQTARDFVFAEADSDEVRRHTSVLLRAIELRDLLLASRLDLDLLGNDASGRWILRQIADALLRISSAMDIAAIALRDATLPSPLKPAQFDFDDLFNNAPIAGGDARARLLPAVVDRLRNLSGEVIRVHALLHGQEQDSPLTRAELRRFVAPEGWPLKALKEEVSWTSPVLRHAVRTALALSCAYFIAISLPWASHPHWLVLSVAVVLRGNLEQTLTRRNGRVLGTLFGCVVVVGLSHTQSVPLLALSFLMAIAIAHSFVMQRYWITATAATVMALLQAHMVDPASGFAIGERAADTFLGALLAWGFSYVLPSWERRGLPNAIVRVLKDVSDYASHALTPQTDNAVEQRLARRRAYDALAALAATLQRSAVEPKSVRVPSKSGAVVLDYGQRLMAHLSMVRMILTIRGAELTMSSVKETLSDIHKEVTGYLNVNDPVHHNSHGHDPEELSLLPTETPAEDVTPWLQRRLQILAHDARQFRFAAAMALSEARMPRAQ